MKRTNEIVTYMLLAVLVQEAWRHSAWGMAGICLAIACWKLTGFAAIRSVNDAQD